MDRTTPHFFFFSSGNLTNFTSLLFPSLPFPSLPLYFPSLPFSPPLLTFPSLSYLPYRPLANPISFPFLLLLLLLLTQLTPFLLPSYIPFPPPPLPFLHTQSNIANLPSLTPTLCALPNPPSLTPSSFLPSSTSPQIRSVSSSSRSTNCSRGRTNTPHHPKSPSPPTFRQRN